MSRHQFTGKTGDEFLGLFFKAWLRVRGSIGVAQEGSLGTDLLRAYSRSAWEHNS